MHNLRRYANQGQQAGQSDVFLARTMVSHLEQFLKVRFVVVYLSYIRQIWLVLQVGQPVTVLIMRMLISHQL